MQSLCNTSASPVETLWKLFADALEIVTGEILVPMEDD
jgi:hypothetical protein